MAIGKGYEEIFEMLKNMDKLRNAIAKLDEQIGLLAELKEHKQPATNQPTQPGGKTVE